MTGHVLPWLADYWWVLPLALGVIVLVVAIFVAVPWQARRRGYSFWLWLITTFVAYNPIIPLVLLALMPNRARKRMREKFRAELDAKLAARTGRPLVPAAATPTHSLAGSTMPERSLGDMPTVAPPEPSLGDEPTRG